MSQPHGPHYPQQPYPPQGHYQPAHQQTTVTTGGLPVWMHVCYALLGWIPCFLGWIIWPIHWWFAKSRSVSTLTTAYQPVYPPPQQPYPPYPPAPPQA